MTEAQTARFLIEELPQQLDRALQQAGHDRDMPHGQPAGDSAKEKLGAVANRIILQIFSVPSLQSFLADYAITSTGKGDGSIKVQLDFLKLPKEIIPELEKLLSVDMFKNHRLVKFIKNGQARTGLEIEVTPKELPGSAYDYAF
jgi:hypothetical protein